MYVTSLHKIIHFIVRYIWIFCVLLISIELVSTLFTATTLLKETAQSVLQSQSGEISGRVDGVIRLLRGFTNDEVTGDTDRSLLERVIPMRPYKDSYGLFMLAALDRDFNVVSSEETIEPEQYSNLSYRDYIQRMKETGQYQISDMIIAGSDGVTKNYTIVVPVFKNGELDGAVFGAVYFDDIEQMLKRDDRNRFYLLGRERTIMSGTDSSKTGDSISELFGDCMYLGTSAKEINNRIAQGEAGSFGVFGPLGPGFVAYQPVAYTEWTLISVARFDLVVPLVLPLLLAKILSYILLSFIISRTGRRYLERHFSSINHLLDRMANMQKDIFRTEQGDYGRLLELTEQGLIDRLTGLSNRSVLFEWFAQCKKEADFNGMLCFLDLDDLKQINDTYGHKMGDCALSLFAQVLQNYVEKYDGIAIRYGGDEFILIIQKIDKDNGKKLLIELSAALRLNAEWEGKQTVIHGSIGVVFYPEDGSNLEELISKADLALYDAKNNGKNQFSVFHV